MNRIILLIAAAGLVLSFGSPAPAFFAPQPTGQAVVGSLVSRCRNHARESVRQNGLNLRWHCGYTGPLWNSSLTYHYYWCLRVRATEPRLHSIRRSRDAALKRCQVKRGVQVRCRNYARAAVNYNKMNLGLGCRYGGPGWNSSLVYHYQWCIRSRLPNGRLVQLNHQRAAAINRCRTGRGLRQRCRDFARVSVRQNQINQGRRCGYRGPLWSSDFGYHYAWCRRHGAPLSRLDRIVQRRRRALARCGRPRPRPSVRRGFTFPRWAGDFLDWCMSGAGSCGQATADAFCRSQGFTRAESFRGPWSTPSRTRNILTNQACTTPICRGFYFINCVR